MHIGVDGMCWSQGSGAHAVLGHGDSNDHLQPTRVKMPRDEAVSFVSCGYSQSWTNIHFNNYVRALDSIVAKASCSLGERHSHNLACTADGDVYS